MGQANLTGDVPLFSRFVYCMVHNSPQSAILLLIKLRLRLILFGNY